ncbi:MAG: sigma-54 dependent transcriptional regulator [Myxococcota bacterium]
MVKTEDWMGRILVVDDEPSMREFLEILLEREGHEAVCADSAEAALLALEGDELDLVISDIRMPGMSGLELMDRVHDLNPEALVVLITAHGNTETAVEAMKRGAYDYLTKPCSVDEIRLVVGRALEKKSLASENSLLRRQLNVRARPDSIVGESRGMQAVFDLIEQIAPTRANILISGDSGTGKELIAREIHARSGRSEHPMVAVNCAAIPDALLESELFGHVRGSFTGAVANKVGLFEVADGGTLFLDEIGDMPASLQMKLLRAIQEKKIKRVGGTSERSIEVRIMAATHRDLEAEIRSGRFREDLYYRLNVIEVRIPALRERPEDIPLLVEHFVKRYCAELGRDLLEVDPAVVTALEGYAFPGNVRELENVIERAVTLARGDRIGRDCLPDSILRPADIPTAARIPAEGADLERLLRDYESGLLEQALERSGGVKKRAARLLGISFRSFRYRYEKLALDRREEPGG